MRKRGMGRDPLEWIGERGEVPAAGRSRREADSPGVREQVAEPRPAQVTSASEVLPTEDELATRELPKYATLIPVTARLTEEQVDYLEAMERRIMRSRRRRHERITKNTIIRAAIELVRALSWDWRDIADEGELVERLLAAAGSPPPRGETPGE